MYGLAKINLESSISHPRLHLYWSFLLLNMIDCDVLHLVSRMKIALCSDQDGIALLRAFCIQINPLNAELNPICHLLILLRDLTFKSPCIVSIFKQDATLHSLFISGNCSTWFGWCFHPSPGAHTTVSTAYVVYHRVTSICRYRGRVGTGFKSVPTLPR
jgi:hypothetical protein